MNTLKRFNTKHQTISFQQGLLTIGEISFSAVNQIITSDNGLLEVTGISPTDGLISLIGIEGNLFLKQLSAERKKSPNEALLSQCLGLAQFSIAEAFINVENGKALVRFQECINALERSIEQAPNTVSTAIYLIVSYSYMEELMVDFGREASEDFSELISDLLLELPEETLMQSAEACTVRGKRFFHGELSSLGFNFYKQALFIRRQLQLMQPHSQALWLQLENAGQELATNCLQKGWKGIADQIDESIEQWQPESQSIPDTQEVDSRLADLAELERIGRAYLSHNDVESALTPFEQHTTLSKEIYEDNELDYYYGKLLIDSYEQTIDIYYRLGQVNQVDSKLREMTLHTESLRKEHTKDEYLSNMLASCYESLAERQIEQNRITEAIELYQSSLTITEMLASMETNFEYYRHYQLETLNKLIKLTEKVGENAKTATFRKKSRTLKLKLED